MTATQVPETVSTNALAQPHHDGSELYVERDGDSAVVRVRIPQGAADDVRLRFVRDGEPVTVKAVVDRKANGETWWRAKLPLENPVVRYRWLLAGGGTGYAWLNGRGLSPTDVPGADDYALEVDPGAPDWHAESVVYEIFPDRFASSRAKRDAPSWAVPR
jgi:alpha-glucosidase